MVGFKEVIESFPENLRGPVLSLVDLLREEYVIKRKEFEELKEIVNRLAEAQEKTEQRLNELVEAQAKTEERLVRLEEAQIKTEERLTRLEEVVERLTEAQRRTEERLGKLEETQRNLQIEITKLSDTIGYGIEDVAKVVLPGYLERHYKIKLGEIERRFFQTDGKEIEINLYAEGKKGKRKIYLIGEAKSRIYERDVQKFISENLLLVEKFGEKNVIKVLFGFYIHPDATEIAKKNKILLVASYMR